MAARALTPSTTTAFLVCLLLLTNLLSSARADCPFEDCVVTNVCLAIRLGERIIVSQFCCKLLEPLSAYDAVQCICKGNPGANLQDLYGLLGSSCDRAVPRALISCDAFGPLIDRNVLTLSN